MLLHIYLSTFHPMFHLLNMWMTVHFGWNLTFLCLFSFESNVFLCVCYNFQVIVRKYSLNKTFLIEYLTIFFTLIIYPIKIIITYYLGILSNGNRHYLLVWDFNSRVVSLRTLLKMISFIIVWHTSRQLNRR